MINEACICEFKNDIMTLAEKRSKFTIKNARNLLKITVDGCAIKDGIRCDYLVKNPDKLEIFIELKGHDIKHAIEQLKRSIALLSEDKKKFPKESYIVCTRNPMQSPQVQILQKKFKKLYNSNLVIKSNYCEISM